MVSITVLIEIKNKLIHSRKTHWMYTTKYTDVASITQTIAIISIQSKIQVLTRVPNQ